MSYLFLVLFLDEWKRGGEALWSDILVGDSVVIKTLSVSVIYPSSAYPVPHSEAKR